MNVLPHNLRPTDIIEGGRMVTSVKVKAKLIRATRTYVIEKTNVLLDTGADFTLYANDCGHVRVIALFEPLHEQSWN